jgi:hypothetical protein
MEMPPQQGSPGPAPHREPPPTPWQRKPVTGELIPCENCGRAVADYRATCPFCGTPTGRPEMPAPDAALAGAPPEKKGFSWRSLVVPIILVVCVAGVAGILALAKSGSQKSATTLSPEAKAFISKAMPTLDRVMAEAQAGNDTQAAHDLDALGDMPALTPGDLAVDTKYTVYAGAVRDYLLQDGSTTVEQVQAAKAATASAIAATKSP